MDISAYLRELLFGHDCVIIPGFGGFIGNYNPARIDKKTATFYPPVKQISFNRNLNHNDGLLVGRISGSAGINYGDARDRVEEFVTDVRKKLDRGENVIFDHIGSFINNQEGNVQFEPDRSANYYLDSFGLESFHMMPLEGYNLRTRITKPVQKDPERQAYLRKILWRAAVIVPLLSVLVFVPLKTDLFRAKVESSNLNPLVSAEFEQNKKAIDEGAGIDVPENTEEKSEEVAVPKNESQPLNETASPAGKSAQPVVVESGTYFLITGSFKSENNAARQVDILKKEGFSPEIIMAPNGFYRVCAISCRNLLTAKTKKDSISGKFPEAWIARKK